ncbi:MAG: PQQ-binding-like beta-propeller repeat protein [Fimbriimonas sp.]
MKNIWLGIGALVGLLAAGQVAAQVVGQDFPNLKGFNTRVGRNGDSPGNASPGRANLRWFTPSSAVAPSARLIVDNTDTDPPYVDPVQGPFLPNANGFVASTAGWQLPTFDNSAEDPYLVQVRARPMAAPNGRNTSLREPYYLYTRSTPSAASGSPLNAATPGDLRTFSWNFTPPSNTPGQYALYVWLPLQPTRVGPFPGNPDPNPRVFPQRYYVYNIQFGANQRRTEIVDSYASGGGWVRLGAGGQPTGAVFGYNGTNPIRITLHNTVPRDNQGQLLLPNGITRADYVLTYADAAMAVPQPGFYAATPTSARLDNNDPNSTVVTAVNNARDTGVNTETGDATSFTTSEVTNYVFNNGNVRWRYTPVAETGDALLEDDSTAALAPNAAAWEENITWRHHTGIGARVAPVDITTASASALYTYNVVSDGSYAVYAYIPPIVPARPMAHRARYIVETLDEDGDPVTTTVEVDQSQNSGWVRIGTRFYHNTNTTAIDDTPEPLRVRVVNYSSDPTDDARYVYIDAIRVVGESNLAVTSTPVHTDAYIRKTRGGTPELTKVVIIADERGVLHCLDAQGRGDGTTREYWTYPSTDDSLGYDPNLGPVTGDTTTVQGEDWTGPGNTPIADRTPVAEMPRGGFDLSTALVQSFVIGTETRHFLYIAAANGRVYCIDMAGRGDNDGTPDPVSNGVRTVGTTTRVWTYPNTYPSPNPVDTSSLGSFRGSLSYRNGRIFVPTTQGRMYALDALGDPATKSTDVEWAYPALNEPTLGPIVMTPSVEFGRVYFGTMMKQTATGDLPGRIYALDEATGAPVWNIPYAGGPAPYFERTAINTADPTVRRTDNFQSSLITVPGGQLSGAEPNTVFALNENRVLYAINADTGAMRWVNDELQTGAVASLGFTEMLAFDALGAQTTLYPIILVPGSSGRYMGVFASEGTTNVAGGRLAWGYTAAGDSIISSMSVSNGWLYGADTRGYLYAWNDGIGVLTPGDIPIIEELTPNNPRGNLMRKTKIRLIGAEMYRRLRRPEGDPLRATYAQAVNSATGSDVFEWGQTVYVLVYDFPFLIDDTNGDPVDPPVANISFGADGKSVRAIGVQSRRFDNGDAETDATVPRYEDVAPTGPMIGVTTNPRLNGYAVMAFPLQNGGPNAVPPGLGEVSVSTIQTAGLNADSLLQGVTLSPNVGPTTNNTAWSRVPYAVANPIGVIVPNELGNTIPFARGPQGHPVAPLGNFYNIGMDRNPGLRDPADRNRLEVLMNGSLDLPTTGDKREDLLTTATAPTAHGSTGKTKLWLVDRSYMALLRPGGVFGLDNVRVARRDLAWQGGANAVFKRFDQTYFANFEDLPLNYPNTSIDYPNVQAEQVRVTKEPNGAAENPVFSGVALRAPRTNLGGPLTEDTLPQNRMFVPTEFEIDVEIPRYQPFNTLNNLQANSPAGVVEDSRVGAGGNYEQGYVGRLQVFVDSLSNGQLDMSQREAFRTLNLTTAVSLDERLRVTTPTVDLGSLAGGTGYSPREGRPGTLFNPAANLATNTAFMHPWFGGEYTNVYRNFGVVNEGNVNLLNVRIAKQSNINAAGTFPLSVDPDGNDPLSWLNGLLNVHSDIDPQVSPGPNAIGRPVILQKPRVSDRVPTDLKANPVRRQNVNLNVLESSLNQVTDPALGGGLRFPSGDPKIGVSVPIGFPVGKYATRVVVYEDGPAPGGLGIWNLRDRFERYPGNGGGFVLPQGPEPFTEPGILLSFNVVESRLTNSYTPRTAPMVDDLAPTGGSANLRFQNTQPAATRDTNGGLIVAWASNRTGWASTPSGADFSRAGTRLYLATLNNGSSFTGSSYDTPGESAATGSRLRDLGLWTPASNAQWFRQEVANFPGGLPNGYFNGNMVADSVRYDSPAFPTAGFKNPFDLAPDSGTAFNNTKLAFIGRGTMLTDSGQLNVSRLFVSGVRTDEDGDITEMTGPFPMANDPQVAKSEPSVLQTSNTSAILFYTGATAGQTWSYYVRNNGAAFGPSSALPFGRGFLSTSGLSATGRLYTGADTNGSAAQYRIAELSFTGQLKGRPYPETFIGRSRIGLVTGGLGFRENADGTLLDAEVFEFLPEVANEQLERESTSVYRTRGVAWRRDAPISLYQMVNGVLTDLLVADTRTADQETGLISYESRLGGRVTIDPSQGTFRFGTAAPTGAARLIATYTPRFLRLSDSANQGGGAARTTAMWDQRYISDTSYWRLGSNHNPVGDAAVLNDRLAIMWNRAAGGSVTARPFLSSLRFGINLPYRLPTLPDGRPGYRLGNNVFRAVTEAVIINDLDIPIATVAAYQMDPANGRIYVPKAYENFRLRIRHAAVDANGNLIMNSSGNAAEIYTTRARIGYVTERAQEPVPIETAVNESSLSAFLDPFAYLTDRRPPLVWLFWTSTRGGVPDIYFQTISPMWTPTSTVK